MATASSAIKLHWSATAVLVLAIQTDVIGDPWVAYCVWGLAGALVLRTGPEERLAGARGRFIPLS